MDTIDIKLRYTFADKSQKRFVYYITYDKLRNEVNNRLIIGNSNKSVIHSLSHAYEVQPVKNIADWQSEDEDKWLLKFISLIIKRLNKLGHIGTAKNYTATLNSITKYLNQRDVQLVDIDSKFIEDYQAWLAANDVVTNSISFYMRILRAVYMRAVNAGYIIDKKPFKLAYTRIEKTAKRAISIDDIRRIKCLDLNGRPTLEQARDIFMFLFYSRGMSFIDAAYLRKSDIKGGVISYRRHKTNQFIYVSINEQINGIISKYCHKDTCYLLPILNPLRDNLRQQYDSALRRVNYNLKKIASIANIQVNLSTYTARHSWATIAKIKGVPTSTIADALGHESEKTTQIYLSTISNVEIDRANDLILEGL